MPLPDADRVAAPPTDQVSWWRTAVVYQVYVRSFADANGDGTGDLAGLRARLPYVADLGVDAVWINPWYASPMEDGGYDVADYRDIAPAFGTLAEAEEVIAEARSHGLRMILDIVPNHTSSQHPWFRAALAGEEAARARYIFRPGRGAGGDEPPNDWQSSFGGPAWTRTTAADGTPGDWYLHLFAPGQPDLDWTNPDVVDEFLDILRFWFDKGVDGFRIDVAHGLAKAPGLPNAHHRDGTPAHAVGHPAWDQDAVHEIYRGWRRLADTYDPPRMFVAEAWVPDNERLARYLRPDELHTAFQFDFLRAPWRADRLRAVIDDSLASAAAVGATSTWVLSNHDVVRHVTRYARVQPDHLVESDWDRARWAVDAPDIDTGRRRARAAALLALALPGTAYLYQGEELGLDEVEDLPDAARQDPIWFQSGHTDPGRDGCRVPLPWAGDESPFGFSPADSAGSPWLPQPRRWAGLSAADQERDPSSMLQLYRTALHLRREHLHGPTAMEWVESPSRTLAFRRGDVECWVNTSDASVELPDGEVLVCSEPEPGQGKLPADAAAWVAVG